MSLGEQTQLPKAKLRGEDPSQRTKNSKGTFRDQQISGTKEDSLFGEVQKRELKKYLKNIEFNH